MLEQDTFRETLFSQGNVCQKIVDAKIDIFAINIGKCGDSGGKILPAVQITLPFKKGGFNTWLL